MNYYVETESFQKSFKDALYFVTNNLKDKNITIALEMLDQVDGIVSKIIDIKITKELRVKKISKLPTGETVHLISSKSSNNPVGTIIASYITLKYLDKLIKDYPNQKIVYIPWLPEEKEKIKTYKNFKSI